MRTVLKNSSEVAHIWAQQNQKEGRCGNLFFEDKSIYSYGRHFEIARFINDDTVLFTTRTYSRTTAKHKHMVWSAISHKTVFDVPRFDDNNGNAVWFLERIEETKRRALRSLSCGYHLKHETENIIADAVRYARRFKISAKFRAKIGKLDKLRALDEVFTAKEKDVLRARELSNKKRIATREANEKIKHALAYEKYLKEIEEWKIGTLEQAPYSSWWNTPVVLRVKDDRIETSKGAQITVKTALRLWGALQAKQNVDGFKLDNYEAQGLENGILTVGCHKIPYAELERIAGILGVKNETV